MIIIVLFFDIDAIDPLGSVFQVRFFLPPRFDGRRFRLSVADDSSVFTEVEFSARPEVLITGYTGHYMQGITYRALCVGTDKKNPVWRYI